MEADRSVKDGCRIIFIWWSSASQPLVAKRCTRHCQIHNLPSHTLAMFSSRNAAAIASTDDRGSENVICNGTSWHAERYYAEQSSAEIYWFRRYTICRVTYLHGRSNEFVLHFTSDCCAPL